MRPGLSSPEEGHAADLPIVPILCGVEASPQRRRGKRDCASARGHRECRHEDHAALKRILAQKAALATLYLEGHHTTAPPGGKVRKWTAHRHDRAAAQELEIDEFLCNLDEGSGEKLAIADDPVGRRPLTAASEAAAGEARPKTSDQRLEVHSRDAHLLADLRARVEELTKDKSKLRRQLTESNERCKRLQEEVDRCKKETQRDHPAIRRLRKIGLDMPGLAELGERWAGYVLGRVSMAMEMGKCTFRSVFTSHATSGYLTEQPFKSLIQKFEPVMKSDQLTRLWFFADVDNSGHLGIFEFMRMFGCNANGEMTDEYYQVATSHMYRKLTTPHAGIRHTFLAADKNRDQSITLDEWMHFLKSTPRLDLSREELAQVFHRMNVSCTGLLTMDEIEEAFEKAASRSAVSEKWVRETFEALTKAVQGEGLSLSELLPAGFFYQKDFRELMLRFMPGIRFSQLDQLWKWLQATTSNHSRVPKVGSDAWNRIDVDSFLSEVLGRRAGGAKVDEVSRPS